MNATQEEIGATLADQGWTLTHHCTDRGSYKEPSKWAVTISRDGKSFTTEYTMGSGFRQWSKRAGSLLRHEWAGCFNNKRPRPGTKVPLHLGGFSVDEAHLLLTCTEPTPPELPDVLWSLVMDAEGVRHGQTFEDWAADLGYDTDSRKAERCYNACRDEWSALVRLGADFDALNALFEDY